MADPVDSDQSAPSYLPKPICPNTIICFNMVIGRIDIIKQMIGTFFI